MARNFSCMLYACQGIVFYLFWLCFEAWQNFFLIFFLFWAVGEPGNKIKAVGEPGKQNKIKAGSQSQENKIKAVGEPGNTIYAVGEPHV